MAAFHWVKGYPWTPGACTGLLRQVSMPGWGKPSTAYAHADRGRPSFRSSSSRARAPRLSAGCAGGPAGPARATMTRPSFPYQGLTDPFGPDASDLTLEKVIRLAWSPVSPLQKTVFLRRLVLVVLGHGGGWMPGTCVIPHGRLVPQLGVAAVGRSQRLGSGLRRVRHRRSHTERVRCAFHYRSDCPRRGFERRFGWTARGGEAEYRGRGGVSVHRPAVRYEG